MFLFGGMAARLVQLQVVKAPKYTLLAQEQRERRVTLPARRGAIFDRNGEPLAISIDLHTVWTDPSFVEDAEAAARTLAGVLDVHGAELLYRLNGTALGDQYEVLARRVEPDVAHKVKDLEIPGVYVTAEPRRYYPGNRLASHLLGFVGVDGYGLSGLELQYENLLHGEPGYEIYEQEPTGEHRLPQAEYVHKSARQGRSLFLTLDKEIQYFTQLTLAEAAQAYHADAGSAIVMRPRTGEILALANVPDFDPNKPGEFGPETHRNRAVTDMYEPGSAYKIVTASAALEEGIVSPHTTFTVPDALQVSDRVFHDSHSHPTEKMTVAEIIEQSSNVGTIQIGLKLGKNRIDRYVRKFGFGTPTGLDFPGEASGIVLPKEQWSGSTIATIPIGQGIAVTPMQMAVAYGMLANGGVMVEPKLLSGTMSGKGRVESSPPAATRRVLSRATTKKMVKILTRVVETGTGVAAQIPGYEVAGKTGTAQKPLPTGGYGSSYVGSFGGFAPARRPALIVMVVLDEPSPIWGGSTAAPTFKTIMEFSLRDLGIAPTGNAERAAREIEDSLDRGAHYD